MDTLFSPLRLASIALVLTVVSISFSSSLFAQLTHVEVEFCINEWSTGLFIKKKGFDKAKNMSRFTAHIERLYEWHSLNPTVINNILQKRYDRMRWVGPYLLLTYLFTVTQEEFRCCYDRGYICKDDRCCKGSRYEGARRTHRGHWQWNWRLSSIVFFSWSYFVVIFLCNILFVDKIYKFMVFMKPRKWLHL